jgi:hypothetical protein
MTLEEFYQNMMVLESCALHKRIFKKHFYENGKLNAADKKAFSEDITNIEWRYTLKPSTINIPRFEDDQYEYLEIAILQINLNSRKRVGRIAQVVQRTIPYPLIIIFECNDHIALDLAEKRINWADSNKIVTETFYDTSWIDLGAPKPWQQEFLKDFCIKNFSYRDLYAFYQSALKRLIALNCAELSERYALESRKGLLAEDRARNLKEVEKLLQEQDEIRNKLKREKNMGTKVQLNTQMKRVNDRIEEIKNEL